ncbi:hypothetical protein RCG23_20370 [Neobacillus sp. PS3-34]|uniref:hypothetical protein n=1 Tax=Neobacillus sp. PS3-34 TaxID=3070678 RepID=UPI0027E1FB47|nr:hypothetical protein [Neobacillus sp. PS3-34]WML47690.1 hypothetical protein RCG23_20370 [Neobacillus sp. PS3-34]
MKKKFLGLLIGLLSILLSGCMYPEEEMAKNQTPYQDQLQAVQSAVESFQKDNGGILPIKTRDANTPIYQKYPIDFEKISPKYMAEPPGNAFESGGVFQYVIINAETKPTVKLFDLRIADTIREIKLRIKMGGYPPFKKILASNVYTLDFKQLGYKEPPFAVSPYTHQNLPYIISGEGEVYVDYRMDLYRAIKEKGTGGFKPGDDIRQILLKKSMFVPAYSLPYTIDEKNEPVFLENKK